MSEQLSRIPEKSFALNPQDTNPTVAVQLARDIAKRIIAGHYAPGANLREVPLAEEFGVSRTSLREALRILERDGVVRIEPRRGALNRPGFRGGSSG